MTCVHKNISFHTTWEYHYFSNCVFYVYIGFHIAVFCVDISSAGQGHSTAEGTRARWADTIKNEEVDSEVSEISQPVVGAFLKATKPMTMNQNIVLWEHSSYSEKMARLQTTSTLSFFFRARRPCVTCVKLHNTTSRRWSRFDSRTKHMDVHPPLEIQEKCILIFFYW